MPKILRNLDNSEIKREIESNWFEFIKRWSKLPIKGTKYEERDEYFRFVTGVPYFRLNGVINSRIPSESVDQTAKKLISSFIEKNLPFIWILGPTSAPENLRDIIIKNDLISVVKAPGMAMNLNHLPDKKETIPGVEILKVHDIKSTKEYMDVGITGLEWQRDITHAYLKEVCDHFYLSKNTSHSAFVAYYKQKPVACARVFYGAGVAGIYRVSTLKEARRKGIGTAISLAPLYEAKERGYEYATLISTRMGIKLYERIGFTKYCEFEVLGWSPDSNEVFSVLIH
ncbi:MAG: GNAT family N-acetyltransferase [Candidatus Hodarchaeales archaeon]|jgi:GNAT superfamily N-acetyltransferase